MENGIIQVERVYQMTPTNKQQYRVLVDRLWPRGIKKNDLALDAWEKLLAPSTELRKWYGHDLKRFLEFQARYKCELQSECALSKIDELKELSHTKDLILLTATKDIDHSSASVLKEILEETCSNR